MDTSELANPMATLLRELVDGSPQEEAYVLNPGDPGLLRSLEGLSAEAASAVPAGGTSSVAAHVDHLRYGLSLLNRWAGGDDPFAGADWSASWRRTVVSDSEWDRLRADLRDECRRWMEVLRDPRDADRPALCGMLGSIAHLAYHLGAIRQIHSAARGPRDASGGAAA